MAVTLADGVERLFAASCARTVYEYCVPALRLESVYVVVVAEPTWVPLRKIR